MKRCGGMSDKPSGHGPCIPQKSKCALCQVERYVQYCAQCQRSYCQDCFKSEHQVDRRDDSRSEGATASVSSSCAVASQRCQISPSSSSTTTVPVVTCQQVPVSVSPLVQLQVVTDSVSTRCIVPVSQVAKHDHVTVPLKTAQAGSAMQPIGNVHPIVHPSLAVLTAAQPGNAKLPRFTVPCVTGTRFASYPTLQPRHAIPTVATFRPTTHARPAVPPAIQPGVRMHRTVQPKRAFVVEPRLPVPTGVPHMRSLTSGAAQPTHVCSRHPGMLVQWIDPASRAGLCTKCLQGNVTQSRSTTVPYRPVQLMAEPTHGHNIIQTCQKHLGLPLIWYSKVQNKLLCSKCCEEGAATEGVLSCGGIHNELWRSYRQLKVWEERAKVSTQLINNTQEQLEKNIRELRGSVRVCLRHILSEVVTKLKKREESLMIQASREFTRQQQELGRLQSAVAASQQASLLTQQLVSHTMLLGPCNQKFGELLEKVQDEMEKAAAADRLVPTQVTFPTLPPFTLDQGPVNEMLLMVDSLGSCSHQPPPAAPQLLMHTQGAQVLLRWRWISGGAAGAARCEFELQCAILPIMVSRMHNQGHKSAAVSTSNQAEVSTPNQQTVEDPNKTTQDGVTIQTRCIANMDSLGEPSKESIGKGSKTAAELNPQLGKGTTATPPQESVNTLPTVVTPIRQGNMAAHSTCETTLTDVIAETVEACLAERSGPVDTVTISQPDCREMEKVSKKEPALLNSSSPDTQLKEQQQNHDDEQSEIPGEIDTRTVNEDTSGARVAEESEVTVVLEKDGDKDAVADMEMPNRKGILPCTCSDLSAISICPAHFKLQLSSDEASSRSSDSPLPVHMSSDQTAKTASGSFLYKEQLTGNSSSRNGTLEETTEEATHVEETSQNTNDVEPTDGDRKSHESKNDLSSRRCDDVVLLETTQPNAKQQVCPIKTVPQTVESVRIVFTGEGDGYSRYRLECSNPSTTSVKCSEPLNTTRPCTTVDITSDQSSQVKSLSSNPFHVLAPSNAKQGVSQMHTEMVSQTHSQDMQTEKTASKGNSCAELGEQLQMASGRHATSVPKVSVQTSTFPSRNNGTAELGEQQNLTFGRHLANVSLQTATAASREDSRFERQPTVSNGTSQSVTEGGGEKTPAVEPQQMKPATPAVPPGSHTGPHREDTGPDQQTKTANSQTPSVPNRAFRTIYIGPAFQHSLLVETSGVVYVFRVRASNAGGCGPWSNAVQHVHRVSRHQRQGKKAVERGTQTPEMLLAHLGSPRKSPAQQKGRGKRKTILLDTSASKMSKMDVPKPSMSSAKGGGFHSRMHERLLVRANMQSAPKTTKSTPSVSEDKARSNSNARKNRSTPKKRKADQDDSVPPKQVRGDDALSDQCREAWLNLGSPEKKKPTPAKENATSGRENREKAPSLPEECTEAWQNLADSTPENGTRKKTPSLSEEWYKPTLITPEMGKPSSLKKGRSNRGSDKLKTPLKVKWSFPKTQQFLGSGDTPVNLSSGSCVTKEDARYAVTAVTNLVDALVSWPIDVELDKDVDKDIKSTPRTTPKSTPDRPSSSKRRRRQSDPSPSIRAAGRTPQTPASLKQRRAPDYFEECEIIVRAVFDHPDGKLFQLPVKVKEVPDYYDIVKDPMDLDCIKKRLRELYYIIMPDQFLADMKKVFRNCHLYNKPDSEVGKAGCRLESYFIQLLHQYLPTVSYQPVYKVPPADGSPAANKPVVQGEPEECSPEGGFPSVVKPNMEDRHDVFCVTSENAPSAAGDMASCPEVKISGSTQHQDFVEKQSVEPQGKQVGSGSMEVQDKPGTEEVADVSQHANGGAFHDPTTALGTPTTVIMSKKEGISMSASKRESSERDTTSMTLEEAIHTCINVLQGAEVEVSHRAHEESGVDGTGTMSATESAESVSKRNPMLDPQKNSSNCESNDSLQISTDKPAAQGKKRRERKDNPCKLTSDEEISALEPWWSYRGEFALISNPVGTDAAEQVADSAPQRVSMQPLRSLSSPSLTIVSDEGDAVLCRNRQRSVSAAQNVPVRPSNPTLPNVNSRHRQMTSTALRSPDKDQVVSSFLSSSPHQDQVTVTGANLQGGDTAGARLLPSQGMAQVDVVGVLMSENSTAASFQEHSRVEGLKSSGSPSRQDPSSDIKTGQKSSTYPKRYQKAKKSFPGKVPQKFHSHSNQPISSHLVSGAEQQPITAQPSASSANPTGAVDFPVVRKDAPLFPGKGRRKCTARKSIRMKVTDNPHLRDLDSPQSQH